MTNIEYEKTEAGFSLVVDGHAGYASVGHDIVCAAISVLVETLMCQLDEDEEIYLAHVSNGHAEIDASGEKAIMYADFVMTGLRHLAKAYPDYVRVYYS